MKIQKNIVNKICHRKAIQFRGSQSSTSNPCVATKSHPRSSIFNFKSVFRGEAESASLNPLSSILNPFKWLVISSMALFAVACSSEPQQPIPPKQYGEFCTQKRECHFLTALHKQGTTVNFYGDTIFVNIPSEKLFEGRQTVLMKKSVDTLEPLADFLSCYQKITVKVIGYSGTLMTDEENQAYAKQQADAVVKYLWKACIHVRMIYAVGHSLPVGAKNYLVIETKKLP